MAKSLSSDEHSIMFDNDDPAVTPGLTNTDKGSSIVFGGSGGQTSNTDDSSTGVAVGAAVQGADGQSDSSTGASSTVTQNDTYISNNGSPVTGSPPVNTPSTKPAFDESASNVASAKGPFVESNNSSSIPGNVNNAQGTAVQGAPGQSVSSTGTSQTSNQSQTQISDNNNVTATHPAINPITDMPQSSFAQPGTITMPGSISSSQGTATPGTSGQSTSTPGTGSQSNTNYSQATNINNQSSAPAPVISSGADGSDVLTGQNVSNQSGDSSVSSPSAVGAPGESASSVGESSTVTHNDTQTYHNGVLVSGNNPAGNTVPVSIPTTVSTPVVLPASEESSPGNVASAKPFFESSNGNISSSEGTAIQGAPGESVSSVGESSTFNQSNIQTSGNNNANTDISETNNDPPADYGTGAGNLPEGTVTATGNGNEAGTNNDHVKISNGSLDIVKGSMSITTGPDGTTSIKNGDINITTGPGGQAQIKGGGIDINTDNIGAGFPTHSTYTQAADNIRASEQALHKIGGWGSGDDIPKDPLSGILGVDKNKLTNPLDSKDDEPPKQS